MKIKKKDKIVWSVVGVLSVCAALSPLFYLYFCPKSGALYYKKQGEGISLSGELEQFGAAGAQGTEVVAETELGFVFDSWNDGYENSTRRDYFIDGSKTYIAKANYDTPDLPFVNLRKEGKFTLGTQENQHDVYGGFSLYRSFENYKDKSQKDYRLHLNDSFSPFLAGSDWILKSLHFDHSSMRTALGLMCLDSLTGETAQWFTLNVYVDGKYNGLYVAIPADEVVSQEGLRVSFIENNVPENTSDFTANARGVTFIENHTTKEDAIKAYGEISSLVANGGYGDIEKKVDVDSFANVAAIASVLKNSSLYEQDFVTYLKGDGRIYCSAALCPTELSCGFWEWLDYSPEGEVRYNFWCESLMKHDEFKSVVDSKVLSLLSEVSDFLSTLLSRNEAISHSLENNDERWAVGYAFGMPSEYAGLKERSQFTEQLVSWLSERLNWYTMEG